MHIERATESLAWRLGVEDSFVDLKRVTSATPDDLNIPKLLTAKVTYVTGLSI
jgi:hypothetical protein